MAFIAIFTFIRTVERPHAAEIGEMRQEEKVEFTVKN